MNCEFSPVKILVAGALLLTPIVSLSGCASQSIEAREQRPFFQEERATETHGRKNWIDRLIEADPGKLKVEMEERERTEKALSESREMEAAAQLEIASLYEQLGRLAFELEWLKKKGD